MDVRRLALMLGALMVAAISAVGARSLFAGSAAPQAAAAIPAAAPEPTGPEVLVATRALPVGTIIGPDAVKYQPWPSELVEKAYFIRAAGGDAQALVGTVVRSAITAGQPITQGSLVKPGDRGFLAAALTPGMRAVTVSVSAQSGVAGFVFPGDRVDLLVAAEIKGMGDTTPFRSAETFVRNLRVLATDQRTDNSADGSGKTTVTTFSTVTVEVTPRIAEKIAVAQTIGQLSLSLRPLANDTGELERAIAAGEVDVPPGNDPRAERQMMLAVAQRPSDSDATFTMGGDVSRFQPRRAPVATPTPTFAAPAPAPTPSPAPGYVGAAPSGPVVRVARGNSVTPVALGAR